MLNDLLILKNKKQPHSKDNKDGVIFDYWFWTEIEKISKKNRASSLENVKTLAGDKAETAGTVLRGKMYSVNLAVSEPRKTFNKELFISSILEQFPEIPAYRLRELAIASVVAGVRTKTYTVESAESE